jgi:DNA-directed RNA polymerase subunit beta'
VREITDGNDVLEKLEDRLIGRYVIGDVVHPVTGEVLAQDDTMLEEEQVSKIVKAGITEVNIRTVLECECRYGICAHCYGMDLATTKKVNVGEAVGIIAAQSIGEPGTQLTMRNFHTGGVAGNDITQGLPRVEEIFEARRPKKTAAVAELSGVVSIADTKRARNVTITNEETGESMVHAIPYGTHITVTSGSRVSRGDALTEGHMSLADITRIIGLDAAYDYIIKEIQKTYRIQSVEINDKHVEVIARQMTRKCRIEDGGDTNLLIGSLVDVNEFRRENEAIQARIDAGECDLCFAKSTPVLLGITKAALMTESFLSAASFQETTKVLTEAAISGKKDYLLGLKENVLIGKLIPAGTGMERYRQVEIERVCPDPLAELEAQRIVVPEKASVDEEETDEDDDLTVEGADIVDDLSEDAFEDDVVEGDDAE